MPRLTHFEWTEVAIGKIQTITPTDGEAVEPLTPEAHISQILGIEAAARRGDKRPTLVYFHWPHDHPKHGKLTTTLCTRILDDEMAARWGKLFRCVQIDMSRTESDLAERIGCKGKPGFAALDRDLKVRAAFVGPKSSSKLTKAIEKAFGKFKDQKKELKRELGEQAKLIKEARALEKAKRYDEAVTTIDKVRFGDVRVGPHWEKSVKYGQLLAQKAERAKDGR
ncbi:MAG: hypothetical protein QNJ98_07945 [Planctomycetota bacterium]|nr:hypothetical protein [Planctomycetota bacterium]